MQRKWEEKTKQNLIDVISKASGIDLESFNKKLLLKGATERDIVYAGLDEVMSSATNQVIKTSISRKVDLRTAAYINAISKLDEAYNMAGWLN